VTPREREAVLRFLITANDAYLKLHAEALDETAARPKAASG
jgi:hypothetical protein